MNLHSGLKYLTLHSLNGKAAEQQESCYLCIHHPLQKEWIPKWQLITQGNITNMEKDLKGLISKTDYLIYMLLGLSFQIITGKTGLIYFPYIWHIFLC